MTEYTNSIRSAPMSIEAVVTAEENEIIVAFVVVQLIDIPSLVSYLLEMRIKERRSSEEGKNSVISSV